MTDNKLVSGQSEVLSIDGLYYKTFNKYQEYFQEKWFLTFLTEQGFDFIPEVISFNDLDLCIVTKSAGLKLDSIAWEQESILWCKKIANTINDLWLTDYSVPEKYTKLGDSSYRYISSFLEAECQLVMEKANISVELIQESINWIVKSINLVSQKSESIPSIIHFDLSPKNVLIDGDKLKIIDWSRSMYSELALDVAIIKEKFGLIGKGGSFLSGTKASNLNMDLMDRLANCFYIYRKAKKIVSDTQRSEYIEKLREIINL